MSLLVAPSSLAFVLLLGSSSNIVDGRESPKDLDRCPFWAQSVGVCVDCLYGPFSGVCESLVWGSVGVRPKWVSIEIFTDRGGSEKSANMIRQGSQATVVHPWAQSCNPRKA